MCVVSLLSLEPIGSYRRGRKVRQGDSEDERNLRTGPGKLTSASLPPVWAEDWRDGGGAGRSHAHEEGRKQGREEVKIACHVHLSFTTPFQGASSRTASF